MKTVGREEPVTIRLHTEARNRLKAMAKSQGRTFNKLCGDFLHQMVDFDQSLLTYWCGAVDKGAVLLKEQIQEYERLRAAYIDMQSKNATMQMALNQNNRVTGENASRLLGVK